MLKLGQNYDLLCNMIIRPPRFIYGISPALLCYLLYMFHYLLLIMILSLCLKFNISQRTIYCFHNIHLLHSPTLTTHMIYIPLIT